MDEAFIGLTLKMSMDDQKRVCVYVDGFNLYHAVAVMNDARLKWLNFYSLSKSMLRPREVLEEVYFFTAILKWDPPKQTRHRNFIAAQKAVGVTVVESNFKRVTKKCSIYENHCPRYEEKQTDVAIATTIMADAVKNRVNRVILVTADSDQVPLAIRMRELFPHVALTLSAPPGRANQARELGTVIQDRVPLTLGRLHAHRLPRDVHDNCGNKVATMPALYAD